MIKNYQLMDSRSEIPLSHVQYLPRFLVDMEIQNILEFVADLTFEDGNILASGQNADLEVRHSKIKWLETADGYGWVYEKITNKIKEINQYTWKFDLYGINEWLQYTEYDGKGEHKGHYDWHLDIADQGLLSNRKLSFECILDDEHSGGAFSLLLAPEAQSISLKKGDMIIYPSYLMTKIQPVLSGVRQSLVGWVSGPSFK